MNPDRLRPVAWLLALALLHGCAARVDASRLQVENLRFRGVHNVDEGNLRERIATQQTPRTLGIRLPWTDPQYYDETTFRRDLDRIERYYEARGYYSGGVQAVRLDADGPRRHVDIDMTVREGEPTRVATLWISGCEPTSQLPGEHWLPTEHECALIRSRIRLHVGAVFTEADFDGDRQLLTDILRDDGHAAARVFRHSTVDPVLHQAHVIFVLRPGPPARFGDLVLHEAPEDNPMRTGNLPHSGYPVRVALRATAIRPHSEYSRTVLADAQRRLFDLGVFGIVRIDEEPHWCDAENLCDEHANVDDPLLFVRVDLHIRVTPTRPYRVRVGFGLAIDQSRSDLHLLASFEHFRIPFLGRVARWRIDERPLLFTPLSFAGAQGTSLFDVGNLLAMEFRVPEVWQGGTVVANVSWDIGPDPINPTVTHRSAVRGALGTLFHFSRHLLGAAFVRSVRLDYYSRSPTLDVDPIWNQQYVSQTYTYLEQQFTWDGRDNPLQTRSGLYASIVNQESAAIPPVSSYAFLRGAIDLRAYLPISQHIVFAVRGFAGAVVGLGGEVGNWPVPSELRFYSGGAMSNRGYPYSQVGWRTSVPISYAGDGRTIDTTSTGGAPVGPNEFRFTNVGGLTAWEFSAELRWYVPPFGVALFFDASDVGGWQPDLAGAVRRDLYVDRVVGAPPRPVPFQIGFDPHPSLGIGLRYISPIGVIRLDLGMRMDDLIRGCSNSQYASDIASANVGNGSPGYPSYYAVSRPKCDFFGLPLPLAFNFAIGEAY